MKNKLAISAILAAIVAVICFAFLYPWPLDQEVQGTIGGVKKYKSPQISEKDVALEGTQSTPSQTTGSAETEGKTGDVKYLDRMPLAERAKYLERMPLDERAKYLERMPLDDRAKYLARMPMDDRVKYLARMPLDERVKYLERMPLDERAKYLERMPLDERAKYLERMPLNDKAKLLERAGEN